MRIIIICVAIIAYVLLARLFLTSKHPQRLTAFALLNIAILAVLSLKTAIFNVPLRGLLIYIALVCCYYPILRYFAQRSGYQSLIPVWAPIAMLAVIKIYPLAFSHEIFSKVTAAFIGVSYLAFRLSYMALEVRGKTTRMPHFNEFMSFAFFLPIMTVGPICRYSSFQQCLSDTPSNIPFARCTERIIIGMIKYFFLANIINSLTFSALLFDGNPHHMMDLFISCIAYYLFLYCNFSGFCDMAVGFSGLIGIKIEENFNNPLAARNIKDFWNRWHITLSTFMRDLLFTPLTKWCTSKLGFERINHAIAISIFVVFMCVGIWHGIGWNYFIFGLMHAVGVTTNHYYTIFLKTRLNKEQFNRYTHSTFIHHLSVVLTFSYVAISFLFFANSMEKITSLSSILK